MYDQLPEPIRQMLGLQPTPVKQTIPIRPEWRELLNRLTELRKEIEFMAKKYRAAERALWARIEADTEVVDRMAYNAEKDVIEAYDA
jgi:hypothetical protein